MAILLEMQKNFHGIEPFKKKIQSYNKYNIPNSSYFLWNRHLERHTRPGLLMGKIQEKKQS